MASCSSSFLLSSGSAFFLYPSWTRDGFPPLPSSLLSPWGSGGDPVTVSPFLRLRGRSTLWRPADRLSHHRLCHGATGSGSGPREPPFRKDPTYFAGDDDFLFNHDKEVLRVIVCKQHFQGSRIRFQMCLDFESDVILPCTFIGCSDFDLFFYTCFCTQSSHV
ncbi:uncharacterized protein [Elaeis guineensis]|uniref:Uncharacterized protein LOC105047816 isoform X2 n=1 Tax=Elaeis guineensis var. tenera TaxID=51953 RepID=A0A8N4EY43_ELAGV|nr:uncharacterized protein LOC105047816 isoform X2 [Elaeis guineensis]